jgi:hypothetical protein
MIKDFIKGFHFFQWGQIHALVNCLRNFPNFFLSKFFFCAGDIFDKESDLRGRWVFGQIGKFYRLLCFFEITDKRHLNEEK